MFKKASLCLYALFIGGIVIWQIRHSWALPVSSGTSVTTVLTRSSFTTLDFPSRTARTEAIIIFASGDGGWNDLEERLCEGLQKAGYHTLGIDSRAYAETDYSLDILQAEFTTLARRARQASPRHQPPLILGGYSMGAAMAIAAGGGPRPPPGLVGLLLMDPCSRGRYGLRLSDQLDLLPTGPGTFSMDEFSKSMPDLRVVQWHAVNDTIDSRAWLDSLTAKHREIDFPNVDHLYSLNRDEFVREFVASVKWILYPPPEERMGTQRGEN